MCLMCSLFAKTKAIFVDILSLPENLSEGRITKNAANLFTFDDTVRIRHICDMQKKR